MALLFVLLVLAGCDLFAPRSPEPPLEESGTYLQPDTPDQVVANIQAAVSELNAQNYRRSFADDFTFKPAASAEARNPTLWGGWSGAEEDRYFSTMVEAARLTSGNELRLNDRQNSFLREDLFELHATYVLTVNHRNPDLVTVQGRLVWVIVQGSDGLWRLREWTDQELSGQPSWSDLKAEFVQ